MSKEQKILDAVARALKQKKMSIAQGHLRRPNYWGWRGVGNPMVLPFRDYVVDIPESGTLDWWTHGGMNQPVWEKIDSDEKLYRMFEDDVRRDHIWDEMSEDEIDKLYR